MTTIVTGTNNKYSVLVSDQGVTSDLMHHDQPKVITQGTWAIGAAGSSRIADRLQYEINYPKPPATLLGKGQDEWLKWMITKVVPSIQKVMDPKNDQDDMDGEAILVTHGRSFYLTSNYGILTAEPYWAIGTGGQIALGVMAQAQYADNWHRDCDIHSTYAVSVAQMHDPFTRGKIGGYVSHPNGKLTKI